MILRSQAPSNTETDLRNLTAETSKAFQHMAQDDPWPRDFRKKVEERHMALLEDLHTQLGERLLTFVPCSVRQRADEWQRFKCAGF